MKKKRGKNPSEDDKKLWRSVTKTVTPYGSISSLEQESIDTSDSLNQVLANNKASQVERQTKRAVPEPYSPPISTKSPKKSELTPIERPVHRKISKGRVPIDARIDLHGMTQQIAYHALFQFLSDAYDRDDRHVLVITGKGTSSGGHGVLKQVVPQWFNNPDFKAIISGFKFSAPHHGGEGALYVRLRRDKGVRS